MKNICLIAFAIIGLVYCAPTSEIIQPQDELFDIFARLCVTMLPEHGGNPREPEPFPVSIVVVPNGPYRPGQQILVTLRGRPDFIFTGFLIQARAFGSTVPVGAWTSGAYGMPVGCHNPQVETFPAGNDTAAHIAGTRRNVQELVWTAPSTPGTFRFELTTVERFGVYWMEQFSGQFSVVV